MPADPSQAVAVITDELDTRPADLEPADAYRAALVSLKETANTLYELVEKNPDDLDGLARTTLLVEVIRKELSYVTEKALDSILAIADEQEAVRQAECEEAGVKYRRAPWIEVEGVGVFERTTKGGKRVWDEKAAMQRLLDISGGSFSDFLENLPEFASLEWKSTPFKDRGINVDKEGLVDRVAGTPTVRFAGKAK